MKQRQALAVGELTALIQARLESSPELQDVLVSGEISNLRQPASGHLYFTLKDERASLRCVMFRSRAGLLRFHPEDGLSVVAAGSVTVYARDGQYQLYVEALEPSGLGSLFVAFEQLKERLRAEGLFAAARKRPLPLLPRRIGLVTSPTGAAVRDMIQVSRRRYPNLQIVVVPVLVQGEAAPQDIVRGLELANRPEWRLDALIVGRGGGSLEELWAFNDERVARAIAASRLPVVSAVGHETDFTIADFVADVRAPTPSAAAELLVPLRSEWERRLGLAVARLQMGLRQHVRRERLRLSQIGARPPLRRPLQNVGYHRQRLDELLARAQRSVVQRLDRHTPGQLGQRAARAVRWQLERQRSRLTQAAARMQAVSPMAVLARGYGLVLSEDGQIVRSVEQTAVGQRVEVVLRDGGLRARIEALMPGMRKVDDEPGGRKGQGDEQGQAGAGADA